MRIIEDGYGGDHDPELNDELTMLEKARVKAHDYADCLEDTYVMLRQDEGISIHAILKNAYERGYIDGFKLRLTGDSE